VISFEAIQRRLDEHPEKVRIAKNPEVHPFKFSTHILTNLWAGFD